MIASNRTVQKRHHVFVEATSLGHQIASSNQGAAISPFSESHVSGFQNSSHQHASSSEKREILIVGRTTSHDKQNIGQKPSKPKAVFCPIQLHQCRGARHNRIAGIVHLRTPTTRKKSPSFTPSREKKSTFFFRTCTSG